MLGLGSNIRSIAAANAARLKKPAAVESRNVLSHGLLAPTGAAGPTASRLLLRHEPALPVAIGAQVAAENRTGTTRRPISMRSIGITIICLKVNKMSSQNGWRDHRHPNHNTDKDALEMDQVIGLALLLGNITTRKCQNAILLMNQDASFHLLTPKLYPAATMLGEMTSRSTLPQPLGTQC